MSALLSIGAVTVIFDGITAISDVSFDTQQGELLGLIGPNGAGKTTMLRVITGVVPATAGTVMLEGKSLDGLPTHLRIRRGRALSQQIVRPFRDMSLIDNVALAAGAGTGILFAPVTRENLELALGRALALHRHGETWQRMQARAMATDVGWGRPAKRYAALFRELVASRAR